MTQPRLENIDEDDKDILNSARSDDDDDRRRISTAKESSEQVLIENDRKNDNVNKKIGAKSAETNAG